ncbi:MAG TPA: GNAT family N-acetyltransferase [Bacillota bacterium]|nr:GNAT family N-acetyltransferase [Bacillota bacterium]HPZ91197.1 GNAT family N-acetyltransferase [Bacillota bacterium]HQE02281.1 GNAT family N-acetyltransferase [Bacillota bacterium]
MEVVVRPLGLEDLPPDALENFRRFQVTRQVLYWEQGEYKLKDDSFVDEWGADKKRRVVRDLRRCLEQGGFVAGAIAGGALVGFASVENKPLGSRNQYQELRYLHVSREHRGRGLGRQLFRLCCEAARQLGAEKLYIGAHPAVETQAFYASLGCVPAAEIVPEILALEPRDLQLECTL